MPMKKEKINKTNEILTHEQRERVKEKGKEKINKKRKEQEKKQIDFDEYDPKIKAAKKSKKRKVIFIIILILLIAATIGIGVSPIFNITEIEITGNKQVTTEQIRELLDLTEGEDNIFLSLNYMIRNRLEQNEYIKAVKIRRELPGKLKIEITEKEIAYVLSTGEVCAYIDEEGEVLELTDTKEENVIEAKGYSTDIASVKTGEKILEEDISKLNEMDKILEALETQDLKRLVTYVNIADEKDYQVYMQEEKKLIHFGNLEMLSEKVLYVKAILEKEKGNEGEIMVNRNLNEKYPYFHQNI